MTRVNYGQTGRTVKMCRKDTVCEHVDLIHLMLYDLDRLWCTQ
jgi:hypothetical protein